MTSRSSHQRISDALNGVRTPVLEDKRAFLLGPLSLSLGLDGREWACKLKDWFI